MLNELRGNWLMNRVLIIEPSELLQAGLRSALDFSRKFEIVGCYNDMQRIEEHMATSRADLVIVNPNVIEFHRRATLRAIFSENVVVVAVAFGFMDGAITEQFDAVIDIFEPVCKIECKLLDAIAKREIVLDEAVVSDQNDLSDREKEILVDMLKGFTNKEIASKNSISVHTVISHRKNITRKTGIKSLSGLTVYALLNNLIDQAEISAQ